MKKNGSSHAAAHPYAANLMLHGVNVLVVGGGEVALRKTRTLLNSGANVTVIAPEFHRAFSSVSAKKITRKFRVADLGRAQIVFAATDDPKLNTQIAQAAKKNGLLVNVAAPPEAGNFMVPASISRGRVNIAVSTSGASAALASALRDRIEKVVGDEWGQLAELLESRRGILREQLGDPHLRHAVLCELGSPRWVREVKKRGPKAAGRAMDTFIAAVVHAVSHGHCGECDCHEHRQSTRKGK